MKRLHMVLGADPEKAHTCGVVYIYGLVTVHTCHPSLRVTAQWEFGTVEKNPMQAGLPAPAFHLRSS